MGLKKTMLLPLIIVVLCQVAYANPLVYFCPDEPCEAAWEYEILKANNSIHCALFDLDSEKIIAALLQKSTQVEVKMITDNNNKLIHGKSTVYDTSAQLMHNKFCIIDNKKVVTGSTNPTENGLYKNNNNLIILESVKLATLYTLEFQELYVHQFGKGRKNPYTYDYINNRKYEVHFCPEDACKEKILYQINSAKDSIKVMAFSFTDKDIAKLLLQKAKSGIDVEILLEKRRITQSYNIFSFLKSSKSANKDIQKNMNLYLDNNPYIMHHKVFIIDNKSVITGSFNPTASANVKNDENILIMHDKSIAKKYLTEFKKLTKAQISE